MFAQQKEAVRKAVERVFAVLFKLLNILYQTSSIYEKRNMDKLVYEFVIIHSMICEHRKESYTGTRVDSIEKSVPSTGSIITDNDYRTESSLFWLERINDSESLLMHNQLKEVLKSIFLDAKGTHFSDIKFLE